MSELSVQSHSVLEVLEKLRTSSWLVPEFQRKFVWTVPDVVELVRSVLAARPIGMATIWEQGPDTDLELRRVSIPSDGRLSGADRLEYRQLPEEAEAAQKFAVLDGLQRCTALTLAFGGLQSPQSRESRFAGRYFLNVATDDPNEQIVFLTQKELDRRGLTNDAALIAVGHFPLQLTHAVAGVYDQWLNYRDAVTRRENYPSGEVPSEQEIARRQRVLARALEGIIKTRLAVYVVPHRYSLSDICEIFEKLNTTGTRVSTVDLIHSWLYSETSRTSTQPLQLRDWMEDFGQMDGAVGWADVKDRPELLVQTATACYVALDPAARPRARPVSRGASGEISSVKAADLLATPTDHWQKFVSKKESLAGYFLDFQRIVAGGLFPWRACPYPVTAALYVAIRYHRQEDATDSHPWGIDDLNALFKAYFWRNALTNRFDQGFLTQLGADIKEFKAILGRRNAHPNAGAWALDADQSLWRLIGRPQPSADQLKETVSNGTPTGATRLALFLPMLARVDKDLLDPSITLKFPSQASGTVQMHHVYPRDWCRNNRTGRLAELLDEQQAGRDWVNSVSNLMPLSRKSNRTWSAKNPGQVLADQGIGYELHRALLDSVFIDRICFDALLAGADGLPRFWEHRADLIVEDLTRRMQMSL
jgi:hypothetical protein